MTDLDVHRAAIVAGDERAFGRWLAGAEHVLRASLRSFAGSVDTESVLQETLLRVWQVAPRYEADGRENGLLRLAITIARNHAISEVRRLRTRPVAPDEVERQLAAIVSPDATADADPLLAEIIRKCRDRLPAKPSEALTARLEAVGASSDAEIAEGIGMKKNTFLQNFTRARKMLEACLAKHGVDVRALV